MSTVRVRDVLLLWLAISAIVGGIVSHWWWVTVVGIGVLLAMVVLIVRESDRR